MSKKKGFFESLLDDITMKHIVDSTKDSTGKPDKFKASVMANLLGYDSFEETMRLGAILGHEGAFDDSPRFSPAPHRKDSSWHNSCENGSEYGLFPQDFDDEEEYEAALNEAKHSWRDDCEDGSEYELDPEDFEDKDEYEEALEEAKYGWRFDPDVGYDYGVDPFLYDTKGEYYEAVREAALSAEDDCEIDPAEEAALDGCNAGEDRCGAFPEAKYSWREHCYSAGNYGLDPCDYETEAEYRMAFDEAVRLDKEMETLPKTRSEYFGTMRARAAYKLANIERCPPPDFYYSRESDETIAERCRFVLDNPDLTAAKYLVLDDDFSYFLYSSAISDHFGFEPVKSRNDKLDIDDFSGIIMAIAKKNARQALEVWIWCVDNFYPYAKYGDADCLNSIVYSTVDLPDEFIDLLPGELRRRDDIAAAMMTCCEGSGEAASCLIYAALRAGDHSLAKRLLDHFLSGEYATEDNISKLADDTIYYCTDGDEVETIELFRAEIFPEFEKMSLPLVQEAIDGWKSKIEEFIHDTERTSDRYEYTRINAWRSKYRDTLAGRCSDPVLFDSEEEYLTVLREDYEEELRDKCPELFDSGSE